MRLLICILVSLIILSRQNDPYLDFQAVDSGTWVLVGLYAAYSAAIFVTGQRELPIWSLFRRHGVWVDLIFLGALSLSSGAGMSPFNFFTLFIIVYVTSGHPFRTAIQVTSATIGLYAAISLISIDWGRSDWVDKVSGITGTAVILMLFGLIIAYRGGREFSIRRKLGLLQQIGAVATPRIGLARSIGVSLHLLRDHFEASDCILVIRDEETNETFFYNTQDESEKDGTLVPETPERPFVDRLLSLPPAVAVIYSEKPHWRTRQRVKCLTLGSNDRFIATEPTANCHAVGEMLDAKVYISVPISIGRRPAGRLYLVRTDSSRRFANGDIDLVSQVANQLTPLIENARLIDRISSNAAEDERKRIARDIHDSIIQPYLGIKFGLESIGTLLEEGSDDDVRQVKIRERIKSLGDLSDMTIENLRGLVQGLADSKTGGGTLLPSIKRFAEKFSGATGIIVHVQSEGDVRSVDRLAPDIFQLAVEGLSNVRKHTDSSSAAIALDVDEKHVELQITNDSSSDAAFRPKSIIERVAALNGSVDIRRNNGHCTVDIKIPL